MPWKYMPLGVVMAAFALAQQPLPPSPWPAQLSTDDGQVTLFQPQLQDFQGNQLTTRLAASVLINGEQDPVFGVVWLSEQVQVDEAARIVQILSVSITKSRFPNDDPLVNRAVGDAVAQFFAGRHVSLSLDKLQATLATLHTEQAAADQIQAAPPKIIFLDHPAVKVQYDGAPRLSPVENSNLLRAVNTPFFVALDPVTRQYFLKGGGRWFAASDPLGPFQPVSAAPQAISDLANSTGYQDPQGVAVPSGDVEIVTATQPTELIWTSGPPQFGVIPNTDLLYYANTDSDVFTTIDTRQCYALLSGRWYTAPQQQGPWTNVPPEQLPADFQRIPADSPKADVLASVPGTPAAQDAVADSYIPQVAAVSMTQFDQPPVVYDGNPDFEPVQGTSLTYAVNTDASVIYAGGQYYCCYNAAWYWSGSPNGPWLIAASVPGEIYTIPPSCPIYSARFVYVYGHTSDAVYFGYLPGYLGSYVYNGVVVYGTGYYYRPWIGRYYYARPYTYGFAAHYDFYTGHWGFNFALALGGGDFWVHVGAGDRFRDRGWFGHEGFRPVYARDAAHRDAGSRAFAAEVARRPGLGRNVYQRRADVKRQFPHAQPARQPAPAPRGAPPAHNDYSHFTPNESGMSRYSGRTQAPPAQQPRQSEQRQAPPQQQPQHQQQDRQQQAHPQPPQPAAPPQNDQRKGGQPPGQGQGQGRGGGQGKDKNKNQGNQNQGG